MGEMIGLVFFSREEVGKKDRLLPGGKGPRKSQSIGRSLQCRNRRDPWFGRFVESGFEYKLTLTLGKKKRDRWSKAGHIRPNASKGRTSSPGQDVNVPSPLFPAAAPSSPPAPRPHHTLSTPKPIPLNPALVRTS